MGTGSGQTKNQVWQVAGSAELWTPDASDGKKTSKTPDFAKFLYREGLNHDLFYHDTLKF